MRAVIHQATKTSEIKPGSGLYEEIEGELIMIDLNLAFFTFNTRKNSSCARTLDGKTTSCPVLTLFLKYDADFEQTGIDSHRGNWDDEWALTRSIRDRLNEILRRQGLDDDYVSDHTFIFVRTLEKLALQEIGRRCKRAVEQFIRDEAPGVEVSQVFWNGTRFDVVMESKAGVCQHS